MVNKTPEVPVLKEVTCYQVTSNQGTYPSGTSDVVTTALYIPQRGYSSHQILKSAVTSTKSSAVSLLWYLALVTLVLGN